jgi:hypothetical protein
MPIVCSDSNINHYLRNASLCNHCLRLTDSVASVVDGESRQHPRGDDHRWRSLGRFPFVIIQS